MAIGNIHGAISGAARKEKKIEARLNIEHLARLNEVLSIPLVLHGGTGIKNEYIRAAVRHGIAKINIGMAIRQPYEALCKESVAKAQEIVYETTVRIVTDELEVAGSAAQINPPG